jgi:hypothetical protein
MLKKKGKENVCKPSKCDIEEKRHDEVIQAQEFYIVFII